jgi:hypothetical protein
LIWRLLLHLLKYAGYHPFTCPISCECTLIWESK